MLNPPNSVKELRSFLGMVQYYQDMWAKWSEMLGPLSDLVGECGETKTTKKNKGLPFQIPHFFKFVIRGSPGFFAYFKCSTDLML